LYLTRDIATTLWKFKHYKPDLNIWVVAEDQKLHFQQQFKVIQLLGFEELAKKCFHLGYSMVLLEGEKMSARKGHMILWDDLLKEGSERALKEIEARWSDLPVKEREKRAKAIALGSIVYFIVKYSPEKTVNFSWDNALRFEGDTGPYLQYAYARANSILEKAKIKKFDVKNLKDEKEINVIKLLSKYPSVLEKSAGELKPHLLANYLYDLVDSFNEFYQSIPVLKAEEELKNARLKLVEAVKIVLGTGLALLGIPILEKM